MAIISISGKIGVGKDTVAAIIQYLIWKNKVEKGEKTNLHYTFKDFTNSKFGGNTLSNWEIRRFADKVKDIVCLLLNCTREQLENRAFKEKELGEEWWYWKLEGGCWYSTILLPYNESTGTENFQLIKTTPRLLMQLVGTECGRQILHPNVWVNATMTDYKPINQSAPGRFTVNYPPEVDFIHNQDYDGDIERYLIYPNWIITDCRFPNELQAVKDKGGITIKIIRPDFVENALTEEKFPIKVHRQEHESETALDNIEFDYEIQNDGTIAELIDKVEAILKQEQIIS